MLISPAYKCKVLDKQERGKKAISVLKDLVGGMSAGWVAQGTAAAQCKASLQPAPPPPPFSTNSHDATSSLGAYVLGKCMGLQALHHHCCSQDLDLSSASQLGNKAQGTSLCTDGGCAKPHPAQPDASGCSTALGQSGGSITASLHIPAAAAYPELSCNP